MITKCAAGWRGVLLDLRYGLHSRIAIAEEFRLDLQTDARQPGRRDVPVLGHRDVVHEVWVLVSVLPVVALQKDWPTEFWRVDCPRRCPRCCYGGSGMKVTA